MIIRVKVQEDFILGKISYCFKISAYDMDVFFYMDPKSKISSFLLWNQNVKYRLFCYGSKT